MWMAQYGTFVCGGLLTALVLSLQAVSYFKYDTEAAFTKEMVRDDALAYGIFMVPSIVVLFMMNKDFQNFY